jgi:hypothetical protein
MKKPLKKSNNKKQLPNRDNTKTSINNTTKKQNTNYTATKQLQPNTTANQDKFGFVWSGQYQEREIPVMGSKTMLKPGTKNSLKTATRMPLLLS